MDLPGGRIKLVVATLLTAAELQFLRGKGEKGRLQLKDKLYEADVGHLSLLHRPSLVSLGKR